MSDGKSLPESWLLSIQDWAEETKAIREVYLFGSRARGTADEESDVDICISLMPPDGSHNWSLGDYMVQGDSWQRQLSERLGRSVSLEAVTDEPPSGSVLLWARLG